MVKMRGLALLALVGLTLAVLTEGLVRLFIFPRFTVHKCY